MRPVNKVIIWISPVILLINILVLCCSTIILTKDFSSFSFLKQSLSVFVVFLMPIFFIFYLVSTFNLRQNRMHSCSVMAYIIISVIIMNVLTFPFSYSYFYRHDFVTIGIFIPIFIMMLYTLWLVCNMKSTPRT